MTHRPRPFIRPLTRLARQLPSTPLKPRNCSLSNRDQQQLITKTAVRDAKRPANPSGRRINHQSNHLLQPASNRIDFRQV